MPKAFHLPHPTDRRRTVGDYVRTACGRWVSRFGPAWHVPDRAVRPDGQPYAWGDPARVCVKCRVAQVLHDTAPVPPSLQG